ncbi:hypothetical protein F504_2828 [Ralstonia pseudosolanacearum FQY_4]|nr:hypothetical protein F504_2828 [Ralstonia pseudosolanacearum FQY_4]
MPRGRAAQHAGHRPGAWKRAIVTRPDALIGWLRNGRRSFGCVTGAVTRYVSNLQRLCVVRRVRAAPVRGGIPPPVLANPVGTRLRAERPVACGGWGGQRAYPLPSVPQAHPRSTPFEPEIGVQHVQDPRHPPHAARQRQPVRQL